MEAKYSCNKNGFLVVRRNFLSCHDKNKSFLLYQTRQTVFPAKRVLWFKEGKQITLQEISKNKQNLLYLHLTGK